MRASLFIFIIHFFFSFNDTSAQNNDFFPLSIGMKCQYSYYTYVYDAYHPIIHKSPSGGKIDSGLVFFTILESTLKNDTTVTWLVEEKDSLFFHYENGDDAHWHIRKDTFQLTEYLTGNHPISANVKIWEFLHNEIFRYSAEKEFAVYSPTYDYGCKFTFERNRGLISAKQDVRFESAQSTLIKRKNIELISITSAVKIYNNYPQDFSLPQNYPNPFNPGTTIEYKTKESGDVVLRIYNILGEEIKMLVNGYQFAGSYKVEFDGSSLPSGTYYYTLTLTGEDGTNHTLTKQMVLLK